MKVNILKRSIDHRLGLLAPGEREVPDIHARRLISEGRAVEVKPKPAVKTEPKAPPPDVEPEK